jgi:catechol 2,3-dioxygenase-like lactoylglutathione lyase family enzyme
VVSSQWFDVGGVRLQRPFRIRRLGHFGLNVANLERSKFFYENLLGFRVSDPIDFAARLAPDVVDRVGSTTGYFMRHGTDHHSFVIFPRAAYESMVPDIAKYGDVTTNQITWQVGTLGEVVKGAQWFAGRGRKIFRAGRDVPGSNWHFYPPDPDGHINELYYGIEQIGWDGASKPMAMHRSRYLEAPELPHRSEYAEVQEGTKEVSLWEGNIQHETREETYDVDGVLLGRPFKVARVGPVRLFVTDIEQALEFYRDDLGLQVTEEIVWKGFRCIFLRANTEHHSIALYPKALRDHLELGSHTSLFSFGVQLGSYSQLKSSLDFLSEHGVTIRKLPPELFPGVDYSAFAVDPDGHAIQLYYYMEQIGWDGKPCPPEERASVDNESWPDFVEARSDTFAGEVFLGPLG